MSSAFDTALPPMGEMVLDKVLSEYECENLDDVKAFLRRRSHLEGILRKVPIVAKHHFGEDARVGLEVVQDGQYFVTPELFIFVITSLSAEESMKCFLRMEDKWWLDAIGNTTNVNLDVRFGIARRVTG